MIIIETPAPPTRERLVLVPPDACTPSFEGGKLIALSVRTQSARDATPEDLERAGLVLREQAAPGTLAHLRADLRDMTARAEKAELDAAEWAAEVDALRAEALAELADARRERDTARAELADAKAECQGAMLSAYAQYAETVRERDEARSEVARLTAPAEGEPSFEHLRDCWDMAPRADASGSDVFRNGFFALYRLGVAHERARQQPAQDRATDEELERAYSAAYARAWESEVSTPDRGERAGLRAVAAHVRQERCLVARVVSASMSMHVYRRGPDDWAVALGPRFVECEPADVPATLARLLGEVAR